MSPSLYGVVPHRVALFLLVAHLGYRVSDLRQSTADSVMNGDYILNNSDYLRQNNC